MKRIIRSLLSAEPVLHVLVYRELKAVCPPELPIELLGFASLNEPGPKMIAVTWEERRNRKSEDNDRVPPGASRRPYSLSLMLTQAPRLYSQLCAESRTSSLYGSHG
jgi:hypothetical protein